MADKDQRVPSSASDGGVRADEDVVGGETIAELDKQLPVGVPPLETIARDPSGFPRGLTVLLGVAAGMLTIFGLREVSWLVGPFLLSVMLVIAVSPILYWLVRKGVPRWLAVVVVLITLYSVILALVGAMSVSVAEMVQLLPKYTQQLQSTLAQVAAQLAKVGFGAEQISQAIQQIDVGKIAGAATSVLSSVSNVASSLILILTLMFFIGLEAADFPRRVEQLAVVRPHLAEAISTFVTGTRSYLLVSTVFGAIVAVIDGIVLQFMGIPLPWLWALLAFVTNYVPNIGFVIGVIPPALLALLDGGLSKMIWVIVIYSVINVVIQSGIQPKYVGDSVGLSTSMTFLSMVFWVWVLGPLGALLAIPMSLFVKAFLIDIDPNSKWVNILIGSIPPAPPGADHGAGVMEDLAAKSATGGAKA